MLAANGTHVHNPPVNQFNAFILTKDTSFPHAVVLFASETSHWQGV